MKTIKKILIGLLVFILVIIIAIVIFIKTFNINRFKPQIRLEATKALNRPVNFDSAKLGISLRQGVSLKINNLVISDDPLFGKEEFFKVKEISLGVDALGYLLRKKVDISSVLIDSAGIVIIRNKDGNLNVSGLAQTPAAVRKKGQLSKAGALALPAILISSLRLSNATVTYIDRTFEPALNFKVSDVDAGLSRISLTDSFPFSAQAAFLSDEKNIRINGRTNIAKQDYDFEAELKDIKIQELIAQFKSTLKAEGVVSFKMAARGKGFTEQALQSNLSGNGVLSLQEPTLKDINILRTVLDKISVIPGLSEKIEQSLSERFKQKLTQEDTVLQDINLPFTIANGRLIAKDAVLSADEFVFKGEGQIGFDTAFSLEGSFLIPAELSSAMTSAVSELEYLLNNDKQIYIPLRITGKASDVKFSVDTEYIAKRLLVDQAKKQIFKALDKALGTQEPAQPDATQQQEPGQQEESKESQIKGAVESILEDIFGQ